MTLGKTHMHKNTVQKFCCKVNTTTKRYLDTFLGVFYINGVCVWLIRGPALICTLMVNPPVLK